MSILCKKHPELGGLRLPAGSGRKHGTCVACNRDSQTRYYEQNKERIRLEHRAWAAAHRDVNSASARAWAKANHEQHNANCRAWRNANSEKYRAQCRARNKVNSAKRNAADAARAKAYPEKFSAKAAMRRAAKLNATPAWANDFFISEIYDLARLRTKMRTGGIDNWHVDHAVPLKHPLVCGLHVEHNLCVIPGVENSRKGNRHWPDMHMERPCC